MICVVLLMLYVNSGCMCVRKRVEMKTEMTTSDKVETGHDKLHFKFIHSTIIHMVTVGGSHQMPHSLEIYSLVLGVKCVCIVECFLSDENFTRRSPAVSQDVNLCHFLNLRHCKTLACAICSCLI